MEKTRLTLSHLLLNPDPVTAEYPELYYREAPGTVSEASEIGLTFSGTMDFTTYFNSLSAAKWKRYSVVDEVELELEVAGGPFQVEIMYLGSGTARVVKKLLVSGAEIHGKFSETVVGPYEFDALGQVGRITLHLGLEDALLIGFRITAEEPLTLLSGRYVAEVPVESVRPIRLAIATTTYRKEEYVIPNIRLIESQLLQGADDVASHCKLFVIDNGQTLDAAALSSQSVSVLPNKNVGGAGGFARGMLEAKDWGASHVLLMDDDVHVLPESLYRTYRLLSLTNGQYQDAFVNGAMLSTQKPDRQFEDVGVVTNTAHYRSLKPRLDLSEEVDILANEMFDVEVPHAYGAWWFSCISLKAVEERGLPLPVFVRCDDVEFGMRNNPTYMTMNGICVWHESFEGRERANIDQYQYIRNFLVMLAIDQVAPPEAFMARFYRSWRLFMRAFKYNACELMLDGLEDYLKGPDYLGSVEGTDVLKRTSAKNELLDPLEELDADVLAQTEVDQRALDPQLRLSLASRFPELLPLDAHTLPEWLLVDEPLAVYFPWSARPMGKSIRRRTLVAVNADATHGRVRQMDRQRYKELTERYRKLMAEYRKNRRSVEEAYQAAAKYLTSEEFWRSYLFD